MLHSSFPINPLSFSPFQNPLYNSGRFCYTVSEAICLKITYNRPGVEKCVLLPLVSPEAQLSTITSEMVKHLCDENLDRLLWFCNVDPRALANLLREHPNLYCDLSAGSGANALMRDREHAARFIEAFSDRLLWGADICMSGQTAPFALDAFLTEMRESGEISEQNYRKMVRENAQKLLSLT